MNSWRGLRKAAYHVRRMDWLVLNWFLDIGDVKIESPIFLLGNQGGGNTFLSRIIRRNRKVISATGNYEYWTGADEMQKVFEFALPPELRLSGRLTRSDAYHAMYRFPRSWSYGTNDLIDSYHLTEADVTDGASEKFRNIIKQCICRYGRGGGERFFDKSQVFTLKTRFIQACLNDTTPYFVLMTRDPIVSCYRAASGKAGDMRRYKWLTFDEKIVACAEHWRNCMQTALTDSSHLKRFLLVKFEALIADHVRVVNDICSFLELEFESDMLPQASHEIPFATRYLDRWWPVRGAVNKQYEIPTEYRRKILDIVGATAESAGYYY